MAKQAIGQAVDLLMMVKKSSNNRQYLKSGTSEEYFNCCKRRHYIKDCYSTIKKKLKDKRSTLEAKTTRLNTNQIVKKAATTQSTDQDNRDNKSYLVRRAFMI